MANNCYNWAHINGSKENLDLLQARLKEAKEFDDSLFYPTFHSVLGIPLPESDTDVYTEFGTRWYDAEWNRESDTSATLSGDSAWSPPSEFFRKLSEIYSLTIESDYQESGADFGGYYNCSNGEVIRDQTYSYNYYQLKQDKDIFIHNLLGDIAHGETYEDYEDFANYNKDVVAELSPKDIEEIKEEFKKKQKTTNK